MYLCLRYLLAFKITLGLKREQFFETTAGMAYIVILKSSFNRKKMNEPKVLNITLTMGYTTFCHVEHKLKEHTARELTSALFVISYDRGLLWCMINHYRISIISMCLANTSEQKYHQRASKSTTEFIERGNRFRKARINVFPTWFYMIRDE